jgi:stearoyl-CoA desaturase (delta-9 desaturase)
MSFLDRVLDPPSYGWAHPDGSVVVPTRSQLVREALGRMNILRSRKNWLAFSNWFWTLSLAPFLVTFLVHHFSWPLVLAGFLYSMVGMGSYGTVWLHRYGTHGTYTFRHPFWRFVVRNLVIRVVPEEIYVVSHHVHHAKSDQAGDPYNARAGALYCFLADTNHQPIAKDLSREDYARVCKLMEPTGVEANTYEQYQRWGSYAHPLRMSVRFAANWAFWYAVFFLLGGHALATAIFGSAMIWAIGIRTFNYDSHGQGKDLRQDGIDFSRRDRSRNQLWPGFVAGEWHNNHHLLCSSARNGFLWYQLDLPFLFIRLLALVGAVSSYRDHTSVFFERHYLPYLDRVDPARAAKLRAKRGLAAAAPPDPTPVAAELSSTVDDDGERIAIA